MAQKESDAGYGTVALTLAAGTYQLVVIAHNGEGSATITSTLKQVKISAKTGRQYQVFTREATMLEGISFEIAPDAGEQPVEPEP